MRKALCLLVCFFIVASFQLKAQPTDRPLNNFSVDHSKNDALIYQIIYADSADNAKTIIKKFSHFIATATHVTNIYFDSASTFTGQIQKMYIKYYGNSRELTGNFTVYVKDGKYKLVIRNMTWKVINLVNFTNDERDLKPLDDQCISDDGKKWESFAFTILPDIDVMFQQDFKIPDNGDSSW